MLFFLFPHQPQVLLLSRSIPINTQTCSTISHHTKPKTYQATKKPLCLNISFQPLPHFSCFLYGKTSQKSNPDLLQMEELVNQHLLSFRNSPSPGCSVHTPLVSFSFYFFFTLLGASFLEFWPDSFLGSFFSLSSLVIYSNP